MTFEECEFMRAEIALKAGDKNTAADRLRSAMAASIARVCSATVGSEAEGNLAPAIPASVQEAYVNSVTSGFTSLSDEAAWKLLFREKWIAMYMTTEPWNDYRRTEKYVPGVAGLPDIPIRGDGGKLPRRMFYPVTELNANASAPQNISDIYQRVWWDAE
jgi:hypothetical protein